MIIQTDRSFLPTHRRDTISWFGQVELKNTTMRHTGQLEQIRLTDRLHVKKYAIYLTPTEAWIGEDGDPLFSSKPGELWEIILFDEKDLETERQVIHTHKNKIK